MRVDDLNVYGGSARIETDLAIIGGGPAGLTIAREFLGTSTRVLVIESGVLQEELRRNELNAVESIGEPRGRAKIKKRIEFHGANSPSWSHELQSFGVRCRVLGGSTHAWAGKSAAFDEIDFSSRAWVPYSGWPFGYDTIGPFLDRAADILNLGPNCYNEELWQLIGIKPPGPELDPSLLRSFFWQFSRSRIDKFDVMRFGSEFLRLKAPNVSVLLNATVTRIEPPKPCESELGLEISTIDNVRSRVKARRVVLAASGIENPRLLLVSNTVQRNGLGNQNDAVGRYLMDHPGAMLGRFDPPSCMAVTNRFGFFGVARHGRAHMYLHGLALSKELQEREELMNCAIYMRELRAPDDPWDALKRILRAKTRAPMADLVAIASSPSLVAKGLGMRVLKSDFVPAGLKDYIINGEIKRHPAFVAREFQSHGLPHKLTGISMDGITEQSPNPESRITLSDKLDGLGVPLARVNWQVDMKAVHSLVRMGQLVASELPKIGLPQPILEDWVAENRPEDSITIDMGHTFGTTRISADPKLGVADPQCRVYGLDGLYVAGSSAFPTSGHVNPTLMILALAMRLADQIKRDMAI